jgi:xylulokinase
LFLAYLQLRNGTGVTAKERCFLACDLGTSSVKAVLTGARGEVRGAGHGSYATHRPAPGWAGQDPEDWWRSLVGGRGRRAALGRRRCECGRRDRLSGQMQGTLPVDSSGRPLSRCLIWLDAASRFVEAREVTRGFVRYQGYGVWRLLTWLALTNGAPSLTGKDPAAKLLWIRKHQPKLFARAAASSTPRTTWCGAPTGTPDDQRSTARTSRG